MDAFARRQRRFMLAAALAWAVLAVAQALGIAWLWAFGFGGIEGWSPYPELPWRELNSGAHWDPGGHHYGGDVVDGLRDSLVVWAAMALLPLLVLPPRRHAPARESAAEVHTSPYREGLPAVNAAPDDDARLRARRARRALVAVGSVSWVLLRAHPQAVIIWPAPTSPRVNGVAVLDLLVAVSVVLAYAAAAAWPRPAPSPRA